MSRFCKPILAIVLGYLVSLPVWSSDAESCRILRLGDAGWADSAVVNGIATVLAQKLGYQVTQRRLPAIGILNSVASGRTDALLDLWFPASSALAAPYLKTGKLMRLPRPSLVGIQYSLAVPSYAARAGLKSFADIARFRYALDGNIYGPTPGELGNQRLADMIRSNRFGLGDFQLVASSDQRMIERVQRAIEQKKPVVFLASTPSLLNKRFDITYLSGGESIFGPENGANQGYSVVRKDYARYCPNVVKLLGNLQLNPEMITALMERLEQNGNPEEVARDYIKEHPELLSQWLAGVTTVDNVDAMLTVKYLGI